MTCRVALMAITVSIVGATASAQSAKGQRVDVFVGTWKMNLAKSTYSPGPAPKSQITKIELAEGGLRVIDDTVPAQGDPVHSDRVAKLDGLPYPVPERGNGDTRVYRWIDDHTIEVINRRDGNITTGRNVISADGKTRTFGTTGKDARGQSVNNIVVYDRQYR
jgi:hypothetical protein